MDDWTPVVQTQVHSIAVVTTVDNSGYIYLAAGIVVSVIAFLLWLVYRIFKPSSRKSTKKKK
jgi:sensor c-di-GMP phosphodiesterase-like protein